MVIMTRGTDIVATEALTGSMFPVLTMRMFQAPNLFTLIFP